jgi:hypothetical protein
MRCRRHLHHLVRTLFQRERLDLLSLHGEEERMVMAVEHQVVVEVDEAAV